MAIPSCIFSLAVHLKTAAKSFNISKFTNNRYNNTKLIEDAIPLKDQRDYKPKKIEYIDAQLTLRADTLVPLDNDMSEKVLNIMEFMDDLDDVQEVHTNAEFPDNFELKE